MLVRGIIPSEDLRGKRFLTGTGKHFIMGATIIRKRGISYYEPSAFRSLLRQRGRRDPGPQGRGRTGGAQQRPVPRRPHPYGGRAHRRKAGDRHEDHDHGPPPGGRLLLHPGGV